MELELRYVGLEGFRLILDRLLMQEETQEGIVPDTLPDITRIVETSGQVFLATKEVSAGNLKVAGTVRATVIYIPEGEEGTRCMDVNVPFTCSLDDPILHNGCYMWAVPRVAGIDAQMVNPRKVLVRAEIAAGLQVFAPDGQRICSKVAVEEEAVQQYIENQEIYVVTQAGEKSIAFSDVLAIPSSKPRAKELIRSRVDAGTLEAKVIGGKMILKGEAELVLLYRSENGLVNARFPLPYSQVMEAVGVGEESKTYVTSAVTDLECELQQGEPGTIAVKLGMLLQAAVVEKKCVQMLTDIYSTNDTLDPEAGDCSLCIRFEENKVRKSVRHFCECTVAAKSVTDASLSVGRILSVEENGKTVFKPEMKIKILFQSEEDELCSVTCLVTSPCEYSDFDGKMPLVKCMPVGELLVVPLTGGLEVRFEIEFSILSVEDVSRGFVNRVALLPAPEEEEERPSVVLRRISKGEKLWNIAKTYQSTIEEIKNANEIEEEKASEGMMLLVPRRR